MKSAFSFTLDSTPRCLGKGKDQRVVSPSSDEEWAGGWLT